MIQVAFVVSLLIAAMGLLGVFAPRRLFAVIRSLENTRGLYAIALLRVIFGVALYFAAPESSAPHPVRGLGVFVIVAGLITPIFGVDRFRSLVDWWISKGERFARGWSVVVLLFGLAIASTVVP